MSYVDSSELRALTDALREVGREVERRAPLVVAKTLADIEADGKAIALELDILDSGDLINSISREADGDGLGGEVGPTVEYGIYQEVGTSDQPARPFMGPAFDRRLGPFEEAVVQIVKI